MDILLTTLGHVFTFIGAITAVLGDTYHSERQGLKKITKVGWVAATVATLGISINIYKSVDDHLTKEVYQSIALKDVRIGWGMVATPFMLLDWEVSGEKRQRNVVELQRILNVGLLSKFAEVDFSKLSKIPQYGDKNLATLTCQFTSKGMSIMEKASLQNSEIISRDVVQLIEDMRQSGSFGGLLAAGCGDSLTRQPNYELFRKLFVEEKMQAYLRNMIELGKLIGEAEREDNKSTQQTANVSAD
ncbi:MULTISPECIES: hypothetical protein [Pseudoalteromonas]|uniref:hypothetical protein n=1 Tax=Pseudoalteromonas TaxID=53246 RepID=UPI0019D2264E|nr:MULTISPECIES: hypothetical protein [Pseudoalteromonas]MBR8844843.1 hypothetical protein [Pseudoalteromonas sp. JC3]MCF2827795.1 hypothetical protein [Pseudoalteromonas sp. OF5H-5]MCF2833957.1 hypothetical protein [Pseudoalteromonas sp. DL2-H6]MCF2927423.1 hypothetical protein [Pseudoalteromonas sp. DL2-H1]UDM61668.1 hypothetical protein KIJ96_18100 [Pseudoalteromonas piscicida]